MTRDEYVTYIYETYHEKFSDWKPISEKAQKVLKEYDDIFNTIMSKELSVKEIKNCFRVLERMYSVRSEINPLPDKYPSDNGLYCSDLNIVSSHEYESTTWELENEWEKLSKEADNLESTIDEIVIHCTLEECSMFSYQIYFKQWDLEQNLVEELWRRAEELGIDMDEDKDWDKKVATEEELQFIKNDSIQECVSSLESIIGWQQEFEEILQDE